MKKEELKELLTMCDKDKCMGIQCKNCEYNKKYKEITGLDISDVT